MGTVEALADETGSGGSLGNETSTSAVSRDAQSRWRIVVARSRSSAVSLSTSE